MAHPMQSQCHLHPRLPAVHHLHHEAPSMHMQDTGVSSHGRDHLAALRQAITRYQVTATGLCSMHVELHVPQPQSAATVNKPHHC